MQDILFIGDEVTAAAFRIAGVDTRVTEAGDGAAAVTEELPRRRMILMTTDMGQALPEALFDRLLQSVEPLVVFLPDLRGQAGALDLEARVRRELGIEET